MSLDCVYRDVLLLASCSNSRMTNPRWQDRCKPYTFLSFLKWKSWISEKNTQYVLRVWLTIRGNISFYSRMRLTGDQPLCNAALAFASPKIESSYMYENPWFPGMKWLRHYLYRRWPSDLFTPKLAEMPFVRPSALFIPKLSEMPFVPPSALFTPKLSDMPFVPPSDLFTPKLAEMPFVRPSALFIPKLSEMPFVPPSALFTPKLSDMPFVPPSDLFTPKLAEMPFVRPSALFTPKLSEKPFVRPSALFTPKLSEMPFVRAIFTPKHDRGPTYGL